MKKYATTATLKKANKYSPGPYEIESGMAILSGLGLEDLRAIRDAPTAILAEEAAGKALPANPYEGWTRAQLLTERQGIVSWMAAAADREDYLALGYIERQRAAIAETEGDRFSATARLGEAIAYFRRASSTEAAKALDEAKAQFAQLA